MVDAILGWAYVNEQQKFSFFERIYILVRDKEILQWITKMNSMLDSYKYYVKVYVVGNKKNGKGV